VVALLAGTLGVGKYLHVIKHLKALIHAAGHTSQLFVVGKINEPKIGNFSEIDMFVVVACSFTSLIETRYMFHDIVTPFELDLALNPNREWDGSYTLDFKQILENESRHIAFTDDAKTTKENEYGDYDDAPVYNSVTQKLIAKKTKRGDDSSGPLSTSTSLVAQQAGGLTIVSGEDSVQARFAQRTFQGLDYLMEEKSTKIEQGLSGIAKQYEGEH
jgi:diphthamide biosynthesis protein 2